jgi:hypothetical protein
MHEIILLVVMPLSALSVRQAAGEECWRSAFYYGAYQNSAMMDVAGYEAEKKLAEKEGDQNRLRALRVKLTDARSRETAYSGSRRRYMGIASFLGMPMRQDYMPRELQPPRSIYGSSR